MNEHYVYRIKRIFEYWCSVDWPVCFEQLLEWVGFFNQPDKEIVEIYEHHVAQPWQFWFGETELTETFLNFVSV